MFAGSGGTGCLNNSWGIRLGAAAALQRTTLSIGRRSLDACLVRQSAGKVVRTLLQNKHYAIAAANCIACISQSGSSSGQRKSRGSGTEISSGFGAPYRRVTDILLVLNVAAYGLTVLTGQELLVWGAKSNAAIVAGQWWRILTPVLLHGGPMHLAVNCYSLNNLGPFVERVSGRARFAAIYTTGALVGTLFSCAFSPATLSVGASGAIFGLGAATALFFHRHREFLGKTSESALGMLASSLLINVLMGMSTARVDNWGHVGGLAGGALASWLLGPRLVVEQQRGKRRLTDRPPLGLLGTKIPLR